MDSGFTRRKIKGKNEARLKKSRRALNIIKTIIPRAFFLLPGARRLSNGSIVV